MDPNEFTQSILEIPFGIIGDGLAGAGGAQLGKNIRGHLSKSTGQKNLVKEFENSGVQKPREAAKTTMEAAKAGKDAQAGLGKNVKGATTKVVDTVNGESGVGHSGRIRKEMRAQNYQEQGFPSRTAARNANVYDNPSHLQQMHPDVKSAPSRPVPQSSCAEHLAFTEFSQNSPNYDVGNVRTATVGNTNGDPNTFFTMKRCKNCAAYGDAMGDVVTDLIPDGTSVPAENYVAAGSTVQAASAAASGILLIHKEDNKPLDWALLMQKNIWVCAPTEIIIPTVKRTGHIMSNLLHQLTTRQLQK